MASVIEPVEIDDVQGVILQPYKALPWSAFLLLELGNRDVAKQWLRSLAPVRTAASDPGPGDTAVHVAFTAAGLEQLGVDELARSHFSRAFVGGMYRSEELRHALGDDDASDAEGWKWGGPNTPKVHAVLMLYAGSETDRDALESKYVPPQHVAPSNAVATVHARLVTCVPAEKLRSKEHFGFADGIGQPRVAGVAGPVAGDGTLSKRRAENTVPAGEFLLGYGNQLRAVTPAGPKVVDADGRQFALGRNGSYLVLRQLQQDVQGFWKFLDQEGPRETLLWRGAQLVGRWPNGASLVKAPDRDDAASPGDDDFAFRDDTGKLTGNCPLGAHIRRTNPRDSLDGVGSNSVTVANQHRMIRCGRAYGPLLAESMEPEHYLEQPTGNPNDERGLAFAAFNGDIERQFEFVQSVWINGQHFTSSQKGEVDPIVGAQPADGGLFTVQGNPVRRRFGVTSPLRRFVTVRGGAYFFMPGLRALKYLAS